jgi:hypothetical protein
MQHFGLFTRLLDWTEDWRIALWFALEAPSREDSALWVVNKTEVEKAVQDLGLPKTIGENFSRPDDFMWQEMNGGIWFFSVEKEFRFPRITAQKGFFSISKCFAPHNVVLNELARRSERGEHRRLLWRLDISANDRDKFSRSLRDEFGMSTESLFPDEPLDSRTEELIADLRTLQNYLLNADPSLNASVAMEAFVADTPTNCAMGCTVARRFATHTAGLNGAGE